MATKEDPQVGMFDVEIDDLELEAVLDTIMHTRDLALENARAQARAQGPHAAAPREAPARAAGAGGALRLRHAPAHRRGLHGARLDRAEHGQPGRSRLVCGLPQRVLCDDHAIEVWCSNCCGSPCWWCDGP